jgi:protein-disulfide isomerase
VASRKQQKEDARAQREQLHAELKASQTRRVRLLTLGGVVGAAIVVAAVFVLASSGGNSSGGGATGKFVTAYTHPKAIADVATLLSGIPQGTDDSLGSPSAPVTITEYGDLVCPTCDAFALSSEKQLITSEVRTGKVRLVFRGLETASGTANGGEYVDTQVAARAAAQQKLGWTYIMLTYDEQPSTVGGKDAELTPYVSAKYLKGLAEQVPGLNLAKWQADLTDTSLINDVSGDTAAASAAGVTGTPTLFVSGPKGTVAGNSNSNPIPTLAALQASIAKVS